MAEQESGSRPRDRADDQSPDGRIVRTATEARQGEIILGRRGIWIWIASFVAIILLLLGTAFWSQ